MCFERFFVEARWLVPFWLKSPCSTCFSLMALRAVDWVAWKAEAAAFLRAHPAVLGGSLTRAQRVLYPGAKEAYAVSTLGQNRAAVSLGGQPCSCCGCWTCSWCEGCQAHRAAPFTAVCAVCDREQLLCSECREDGRLYQEIQVADEATTIEISGYRDESGSFVRIEPLLRFPVADLPRTADGSYDIEAVLEHLGRQWAWATALRNFGGGIGGRP